MIELLTIIIIGLSSWHGDNQRDERIDDFKNTCHEYAIESGYSKGIVDIDGVCVGVGEG